MKSRKKIYLIVLSAALMSAIPIKNTYRLSKDYTVTIHGTSNLHSWDEKVGVVTGEGAVNLNDDGSYDIKTIQIKMEVHSIKSDMGSMMNNNTYKALKADENPQIVFALSAPLKTIKIKSGVKTFAANGNLTIAGVTLPVNVQVRVTMPESGKILFEGSETIKMTDYNIKPPTALLGTLRTGNEITINFKTNFSIQQ